ncbi:MAG: YkgJ family cysteine cluster protein [Kiritimatiellia bacterium]
MRLQPEEPTSIARLLNMTPEDFVAQYTSLTPDRRGLALTEQPNGACVFLKENTCLIQAAKPQQCRNFPNRWNFEGFEKICRAKKIVRPPTQIN